MFELLGYVVVFILGVGAGLVYSILKPLKWSKAQEEVKDKIT